MALTYTNITASAVESSTEALVPHLVLASGSPRRRELLALLGIPFTIRVTDAEESEDPAPAAVLTALPSCPVAQGDHPTLRAWRKAQAAWMPERTEVVLGADTIVVLDGEVLNKPAGPQHAREMLARLSGRVHTVYTGLCVCSGCTGTEIDTHLALELVASEVQIAPLSAAQIDAYVATGEPLDKAGAYGIQGLGGQLVRGVAGSYTAVVGLPLPATRRLLAQAGVRGLHDAEQAYHVWLASQGKEPLPWPPTLP